MSLPFSRRYFLLRSILAIFSLAVLSGLRVSAQETLRGFDDPVIIPQPAVDALSPFADDKPSEEMPRLDVSRTNSGALNNLFSHQWVRTDPDRTLKGTVVTLAGQDTLSVSGTKVMLAQKGRVIATVESNVDGEFIFRNVLPGYYSIIAEADNSFATYGLAVLSDDSGSHLPNAVELRVIRPKGDDIRRILNIDMLPTTFSNTDEQAVRDPIAAKRVFAKSHRVLSTKDGKVVGQLSQLGVAPELVDMSQMKAMLLKDGKEIGRSNVTKDGEFQFDVVEPGCYGFTAAGNRGVAAVAFCVVKPDSLTQQKSNIGKLFVSAIQDTAEPQLNVELADGADVMSVQDHSTNEEVVAGEEMPLGQPMPLGGSNMFGAGQVISGGGSGMGGGLESLAGLGALGAIAYVISNNDDDEDNAVVSPIVTR